MSANSKIEWTDATWNPVRARYESAIVMAVDGQPAETIRHEAVGWHCEHVSEGCRNCYAETFNLRLGTGVDYKPGNLAPRGPVEVFLDDKMLLAPLRWTKPRTIFVGSMTDLFADFVTDDMLDRVFAVMALCPQHTFQLLTKRPERMRAYLVTGFFKRAAAVDALPEAAHHFGWPRARAAAAFNSMHPLPNVWLGTSVEDQAAADARIPPLLATPAAKRFLSCEPLLGPVDLTNIQFANARGVMEQWDALDLYLDDGQAPDGEVIDWVIAGGESGHGARPMHPDWARTLRDQCAAAGVPFFFKQWGEWMPLADRGGDFIDHLPDDAATGTFRRGKKRAGRLLDGVTHDAVPA